MEYKKLINKKNEILWQHIIQQRSEQSPGVTVAQ